MNGADISTNLLQGQREFNTQPSLRVDAAEIYKTVIGESNNKELEDLAKKRQDLRFYTEDVAQRRKEGKIGPNDTIVVAHTVHEAIQAELPQYLRMLNGAQFLFLLQDPENPDAEMGPLSELVTKFMRTPDWLVPWAQELDSTLLHGESCMEVVADNSSAPWSRVEYFPRSELIIPKGARSFAEQKLVGRRLHLQGHEIRYYQRRGFIKPEAVNKIITAANDQFSPSVRYEIDRVYIRDDNGAIFMGLRSPVIPDEWINPQGPIPLHEIYKTITWVQRTVNGRKTRQIAFQPPQVFPIVHIPYIVSSQLDTFTCKGRAFFDAGTQEVLTNLTSAAVNRARKAASVYGSSEDPDQGYNQQTVELAPDKILPKRTNFWSMDLPSADILRLTMGIKADHQQGLGRPDLNMQSKYNLKAAEVQATTAMASDASMNKLLPFALSVRRVCEIQFHIFQWNLFKLAEAEPQTFSQVPAVFRQGDLLQQVLRPYVLLNNAIMDIPRKEATAQRIVNILPSVQNRPVVADILMKKLVGLLLPDMARELDQGFTAGDQLAQVAVSLFQLLQNVPQQMTPENLNDLQQALNQAGAVLSSLGLVSPPLNQASQGGRQAAQGTAPSQGSQGSPQG